MDLFSLNLNNNRRNKSFEPFICRDYKSTYYIYYFNWEKQSRTKLSTKTKNQGEAFKKLTQFKKNYFKGTYRERIKYVSDLKSSILHYYKQSHSPKTLEIYNTAFNKFMSVNGDIELRNIYLRLIEDFKIKVAEVNSKTTANIYLRTLNSAFHFAKKMGFIFENPFDGVKKLSIPPREKISFEPEQMQIILNSIDKPFLKRIVLFAVCSGARIGEILSLQWGDVSEARNLIHIKNKPDFTTKTKQERYVPLTKQIRSIIEENPYEDYTFSLNKQQSLQFFSNNVIELDYKREKNYVFGKPDGTKLSTGYVSKSFKKVLIEQGFDDKFHFHCLRHTACTNMAIKGIPTWIIKDVVGHSDIKTTQGYVKPSFRDIANWLEGMDYNNLGIVGL